MNPQQQQIFNAELFKERDKQIVSWNNELREWYPLAIKALNYVSVRDLQASMSMYGKLLETQPQGINLNVFGCLCNGLESCTPAVMGYTPQGWAKVMAMNAAAVDLFMQKDVECRMIVAKRLEIANARPSAGVAGGMKLIKGEA